MWEILDMYVQFKEASIRERFVKFCDISQILTFTSTHTYVLNNVIYIVMMVCGPKHLTCTDEFNKSLCVGPQNTYLAAQRGVLHIYSILISPIKFVHCH